MVPKARTSQQKPITQTYKYKGKIVITNNDKITTISPKQPYESMTLVKRIQKPKKWLLMYRFKLSISGRGALY